MSVRFQDPLRCLATFEKKWEEGYVVVRCDKHGNHGHTRRVGPRGLRHRAHIPGGGRIQWPGAGQLSDEGREHIKRNKPDWVKKLPGYEE